MADEAIDQAALLLLERLVADLRAGRVAVVECGAVDDLDRCELKLRWALRAAVTAPASEPTQSVAAAPTTCPDCGGARRWLVDRWGCLACGRTDEPA